MRKLLVKICYILASLNSNHCYLFDCKDSYRYALEFPRLAHFGECAGNPGFMKKFCKNFKIICWRNVPVSPLLETLTMGSQGNFATVEESLAKRTKCRLNAQG